MKPELFVLVTDQGILKTTEGQKLMLASGQLCEAEMLQKGDQLMHREGIAEIQAIRKEAGNFVVYELDTTSNNLFWADGFLVEGMV